MTTSKRIEIRGTHPYQFRSGQWAEIEDIEYIKDRPCFVVRFPDGATDSWVIYDHSENYEFRESEIPIYLACGCAEGTHENTSEAIYEAHPDIQRLNMTDGVHFYPYVLSPQQIKEQYEKTNFKTSEAELQELKERNTIVHTNYPARAPRRRFRV